MTAATARRTWTEAEVREALSERMPGIDFDRPRGVDAGLAPLDDCDLALVRAGWADEYTPEPGHPGTLFADLRGSEADELKEAIHAVEKAAAHYYIETLREGAIRVALAFAEAHPDVPLGHWKPAAER